MSYSDGQTKSQNGLDTRLLSDDGANGTIGVDNSERQSLQSAVATARFITVIAVVVAIICIIIAASFASTSESTPYSPSPPAASTCAQPPTIGRSGVVSSTHYLAANAGLSILQSGGNAFDAAAAVQFALNVVQPMSTGVGGGCFIMIWRADQRKLYAIDGREEAPDLFTEDMFCADAPRCTKAINFTERVTGGNANGVPGVVAAVSRMLTDHGSKSMSDVLQPAINLADNGFPVYTELYNRLLINRERMSRFDATRTLFFPNNNMPLPIGETFYNHDLAKTFRQLANEGASSFYTGSIAQDIVNASRNAINTRTDKTGVMTMADIAGYRAVYRPVINATYRGYTVAGMNFPSGGGTGLGQMLNHLELFAMNEFAPLRTEWLHRLIDAQDLTFADRAMYYADADWADVPVVQLLNKSYAKARANNFSRALQSARSVAGGTIPAGDIHSLYASAPLEPRRGTTHLVTMDNKGNIVSMTTTIEENFGSGVVVPNRGFLLNNELTDFTALPNRLDTGQPYANRPQGGKRPRRTAIGADAKDSGGKRPLSTMTPTIVFNGTEPWFALGSPGGSYISGTVLNALINIVDGGMCLGDAIAAPRMISRNGDATAELALLKDPAMTNDLRTLKQRLFKIDVLNTTGPLGYIEGGFIAPNGDYYGNADSTRLTVAAAVAYS